MAVKLIPEDRPPDPFAAGMRRRDDPKFASTQLAAFQYLCLAVLVFLLAGFWRLQVQDPEFYAEMAERNRIRSVPIPAPRGKIFDREGRVIVDNHYTFSLMLSRVNLKDEQVSRICEGLNLDCEDLRDRLRRYKRTRPDFQPISVKEELSQAEISFVEAHRGEMGYPEMLLIHESRRAYPVGGVAAHVIGYTGEVSDSQLNTSEFAAYESGDVVGQAGVERYYNETLAGKDGQRRVVVDNLGRMRKVIDNKEAEPGRDLQLTLDLDLQAVAELAMEGKRGAVVALDPRNGEILAMASRPAYDPNRFAGRIRSRDWNEIVNNPEKPLLNRAVQGQLAPGSTFKPFLALAALEAGVIESGTDFVCHGGASFYGRFFHCHLARGHGAVQVVGALARSCDVFFYNVGNRMGIDAIASFANDMGFGAKTGVDLPSEAEGLVPSSRWKLLNYRQKWYAGETISVAIGQGALTVTPMQLAAAMGGMASGGVWYRPHLRKDLKMVEPRKRAIDPGQLAEVLNGMNAVINPGGTAAAAMIPGVEFSGKTGTAQLASNDLIRARAGSGEGLEDNGWFIGFAPKNNPEIVVATVFEAGEHGSAAALIARDVIKAYYDKKARVTQNASPAADSPMAGLR
jgi:penicillin-binding protein 2